MKRPTYTTLTVLLFAMGTALAADRSQADQEWKATVEEMIINGATRISTPSPTRAGIAKDLAKKHQCQVEVEQTSQEATARAPLTLTDADKKWQGVVEKMILDGKTQISTPSAVRVEIAKVLAKKHGREVDVVKTAKGTFSVHFLAQRVAAK